MTSNLPDTPSALTERSQQQAAAMVREAFEAGFRQGWHEAFVHINRMAAAAIGEQAPLTKAPEPVAQQPIDYSAMHAEPPQDNDVSGRQRAPRGSVPAAVDAAFAQGAPNGLTYAEIIRRIRAAGNEEIKESSIRNEMRRRLSRGDAIEVDGRWTIETNKQEAPQAGPDGASADQMQEPTLV